jgi:hypothetical protein
MSNSRDSLVELFTGFRKYNFRRKRLVWCRFTSDTLFSFELQRSSFGDQYFINIGVLFLHLKSGDHYPPHKCHFYGRYGDDATLRSLNFETSAAEERAYSLPRFRDNELVPLALQCSTKAGAVSFYDEGRLSTPMVLPEARGALGLRPA